MKNESVYLNFKTDKRTCYYLSEIAHIQGRTQPELINEICQNYVNWFLNKCKEMAEEDKKNSPQ